LEAGILVGIEALVAAVTLCAATTATSGGFEKAPLPVEVYMVDVTGSFQSQLPAAISWVTRRLETSGPGILQIFAITGHGAEKITGGVLPRDRSPLRQDLYAAKRKILEDWREKAKNLRVEGDRTDVFGSLWYVSSVLENLTGPKEVFVLSDLRHCTRQRELNFESMNEIHVDGVMQIVRREGLLTNLKGVRLHMLGVSVQGKSIRFWTNLRELYRKYVLESGGELATFSPDLDVDVNSTWANP